MITLGEYVGYRGPPCSRKIRHESQEAAEQQLVSMLTRMRVVVERDTLAVYQCPYCEGWHVGHNKYLRRWGV